MARVIPRVGDSAGWWVAMCMDVWRSAWDRAERSVIGAGLTKNAVLERWAWILRNGWEGCGVVVMVHRLILVAEVLPPTFRWMVSTTTSATTIRATAVTTTRTISTTAHGAVATVVPLLGHQQRASVAIRFLAIVVGEFSG